MFVSKWYNWIIGLHFQPFQSIITFFTLLTLFGHSVSPLFVLTYFTLSLSRSDPVNPVQQCYSCFNLIISDQATSRLQMQLMLYDFLFQTNWSPHCSRPTCAQSWAAGTRSAIPGTETSPPTCDSRGPCFRIIHSVISYQACAMEGQASSPCYNKH